MLTDDESIPCCIPPVLRFLRTTGASATDQSGIATRNAARTRTRFRTALHGTMNEASVKLEEKLKQLRDDMQRDRENKERMEGNQTPISTKLDKRKKNLIFDEERFEETFLKCLICRENFDAEDKMPKMLPCHHTFCLDCLRQMWRVEGEYRQTLTSAFRGMPMAVKIQCPSCRDGLITSEAEVRRLPNDHTILELLSFVTETGRSDVQFCSKHQMQPLNFFCEPCITPVCCDCTVLDHKESKGHVVVNVDAALEKYTPILEKTMEEIHGEQKALGETKFLLGESRQNLDRMQQDLTSQIRQKFNRLRETIEERERELYEMSEREINRKRSEIDVHINTVAEREKSLQRQFNVLQSSKEEKDISTMFSGHKTARDILAQKIQSVPTDIAEHFLVLFESDERKEINIRQEIANFGDCIFQE